MATQRTAIVTGGMGGLGESISIKLADAGYKVIVTYSPSNTKYRTWLEEMKSKGVEFKKPPTREFYGFEALFVDDSGNWFSLSQLNP